MPAKGEFLPLEDRLIKYRHINSDTGCWEWTGALVNGYGHIGITEDGKTKHKKVHRVAYEHWRSSIPSGLTIDHLCRNTRCFNPDHLEPVTLAENIYRGRSRSAVNLTKTHCANGHEFSPENTYLPPSGQRVCRTCHRQSQSARRARRAASLPPKDPRKPFSERAAKFIDDSGEHWIWTGHVARTGPVLMDAGRKVLVKRWAFEQAGGEVSARNAVYSGCGEERCVKPEHMVSRTRSEIITEAKRRHAST